jgi:hypothetical protein
MRLLPAILAVALSGLAPQAQAARCAKQSPAHAVALIELYTSEGCNSCPPADRWLSELARGAPKLESYVALSLHVDYWDRLGWKDRFASPRYTKRQHELAALSGGTTPVYTPGVFVNLREFRRGHLEDVLRAVNTQPAEADIRIALDSPAPAQLAVTTDFKLRPRARPKRPQAFIALYEDGLRTRVRAGENEGVTLHHDRVVREWFGPIDIAGTTSFSRVLALAADWQPARLGVAAFVQDAAGREVLQATSLANCAAP